MSAKFYTRYLSVTILMLFVVSCTLAVGADEKKGVAPKKTWPVRSMERPRPPVLTPPAESTQEKAGKPPQGAIVLFDGKTIMGFNGTGKMAGHDQSKEPSWKIENGYMEVIKGNGGLESQERFGDCQIHVEWATPSVVSGKSQGRGNSGILLGGHGEVQVLDSYENDTYPDGQAAAIYMKFPPQVNVSRKPGEWQMYDIIFVAPRFDEAGQQIAPANLTVMHNGVCVHVGAPTGGKAKEISLGLQNHNNPVRYRNVWVLPMKGYDSVAKDEVNK